MIGDSAKGRHPIIAVNDTLQQIQGKINIKDADSRKDVFNTDFSIDSNGKTLIGELPAADKTALWLIHWEYNGNKYFNHYLAFRPCIELETYLNWLPLLQPWES